MCGKPMPCDRVLAEHAVTHYAREKRNSCERHMLSSGMSVDDWHGKVRKEHAPV